MLCGKLGLSGGLSVATSKNPKPAVIDPQGFYKDFPLLNANNHRPTSLATPYQDNPSKPYKMYNCFAFVVGDRKRWWWPAGAVTRGGEQGGGDAGDGD